MSFPLHPARACAFAIVLAAAAFARADVAVAAPFGDHAVLQRDKPVPVWGTGAKGEKVTVSFAGQQQSATVGPDGRWIVYLPALPASAAGADLVVAGSNTLTLRNVVVGEVWLCAGESNMERPVGRATPAAAEITAAANPLIRHVRIEPTVAEAPADTVKTGGWQMATPDTTGAFTAVGYFFARDLQPRLGVPIGLVHAAKGPTPIEAWLSPAALAGDPAFAAVGARWREDLAAFASRNAEYDAALATWTQAEAAARALPAPPVPAARGARGTARIDPAALHQEWLRRNPRPRPPRGPGDPRMPAGMFNGTINPLLPYALRGVLWYQGESDTPRAGEYRALLGALVTSWRAHFAQEDLSFYWVNLAAYAPTGDQGEKGRSFALLREAQTRALALPSTGQAVAIDLGEARDLHPASQQEIGRRLALLARNRDYDSVCDDTGPTFAGATREGAAMRVRFEHAAGGLVAHEKPVQALELAGADRVFHPAAGRIERDTLVVTSPQVREPVAVRYAFINFPEANLYNGAGLPAVPFRSDDG